MSFVAASKEFDWSAWVEQSYWIGYVRSVALQPGTPIPECGLACSEAMTLTITAIRSFLEAGGKGRDRLGECAQPLC